MNNWKKMTAVATALICGITTIVTGVTVSAEGSEEVTISFLGNKVEIHDALQDAINRYMELNPNVTITFETVGGGADSGGDLKARLSSDSMPTIFAVSGTNAWIEWADYLEDLSDQPWVENVSESALSQCTNDEGKVLGIPYAVEGYGFVYNKRIFDAAGIDASELKTYDEIDMGSRGFSRKGTHCHASLRRVALAMLCAASATEDTWRGVTYTLAPPMTWRG